MSTRYPNPGAMVINPKNPDDWEDYIPYDATPRIKIFILAEYIDIPFFLFDQEESLTHPREESLCLGIGVEDVKMAKFWTEIIISGLKIRTKLCEEVYLTERDIAELIYLKRWPLTKDTLTGLLKGYDIAVKM
jgi:hypothetical protein